MNYSETYFELDSEEATHCDHCHLICCVYIKGHVEMVDTKDQSNAIVYWVWYFVCWHCWYKDQSMQGIECYICWHCRYKTRISNAFNAIYVDTVNTKHIHTFLLITFLIFNGFSIHKKFWKAETQGFSTIPSILYMSTLSIQDKDL